MNPSRIPPKQQRENLDYEKHTIFSPDFELFLVMPLLEVGVSRAPGTSPVPMPTNYEPADAHSGPKVNRAQHDKLAVEIDAKELQEQGEQQQRGRGGEREQLARDCEALANMQ